MKDGDRFLTEVNRRRRNEIYFAASGRRESVKLDTLTEKGGAIMFLVSYVWLNNQIHAVISESIQTHNQALDKLRQQGGTIIQNERKDNDLGSVIVNGKKSVWPLTKSEGLKANG